MAKTSRSSHRQASGISRARTPALVRNGRSLVGARVDLDLDAVWADDPALGELQLQPVDAVGEQALAAPEDRREDHQAELVHQVRCEQSPHERAAPGDEDR